MTPTTVGQPAAADARLGSSTEHPVSPPPRMPFTEAERAAFQAEDRHMAMAVIGIMSTIFLLAVLLYTAIAFIAASGPS